MSSKKHGAWVVCSERVTGYWKLVTLLPAFPMCSEDFLSEPIVPRAGSFDAAGMGRGEPGAPHVFTWREVEYTVARLVATWKSSGKSTCGETYLRRHWFDVETTDGSRFTLYCERQARSQAAAKARWWVYSKSQNVEESKGRDQSCQ